MLALEALAQVAGMTEGNTVNTQEQHSRRWKGPVSFQQLLIGFVILTASSVMVRRVALDHAGWFDPQLPRCHDADLCLCACLC
jgi:hypothetical protein